MPHCLRTMVAVTLAFWVATAKARPLDAGHITGTRHHHNSHKRLRHARISAVKQEILNKLGYTDIPDVSRVNATTEERRRMLQLYRRSVETLRGQSHTLFEEQEYFAKQFFSFVDAGTYSEGGYTYREPGASKDSIHVRFMLNIPQPADPTRETHVHSANLKLYKASVSDAAFVTSNILDKTIRVNIYQLMTADDGDNRSVVRKLLDSRMVSLERTGWEQFEISEAVDNWLQDPSRNLGVEISCETGNIKDFVDFATPESPQTEVSSVDGGSLNQDRRPTLDVLTQERTILGRQKRSDETFDCVQGDGESRCCRYPLWISFEDIGWSDWVIEPAGYQAYFCDGRCPHRYKAAHNFSNIKSLINMFNPAAAPAPCCTATKLSPIEMLHFGPDGQLKVSVYEDMVVNQCKCA